MIDNITDKTILLICPRFYNYDIEIRDTLLRLGAKKVILKQAIIFSGSFRNYITWRTFIYYLKDPYVRTKWTNDLKKEVDVSDVDILFCVENMSFKKEYLDYVKKKNPAIKTFLFLWDTFRTQQPRYFDYLPKFDYVFSFDRDDAKKYKLNYYPDFYVDNKLNDSNIEKYDLSFIGTLHPVSTLYRAELLHKILVFCKQHKLKTFFYLRYENYNSKSKLKRILHSFLQKNHKKYIKTINAYINDGYLHQESLSLKKVDEVFNNSKVILDLSHRNRQGMTINCITSLAKGKKLITTNKRVKDEDFYSPNNVFVIDEYNPILNIDFFTSSLSEVDLTPLRIDNWLKYILNR